jgi:hypothetical protein
MKSPKSNSTSTSPDEQVKQRHQHGQEHTTGERGEEMIDMVATQVEQLRLHYDHLNRKKKEKEDRKLAGSEPSKRQLDMYEEGKRKLLLERSNTNDKQNIEKFGELRYSSSTASSGGPSHGGANSPSGAFKRRDPSPIPICDRLYDQGMAKVMAEKKAERLLAEKEETRRKSLQTRDPSPIPICDRLYEQGINKVMAEKEAAKRNQLQEGKGKRGSKTNSKRRGSRNPSPMIPICDRLYEQGMAKKKEKERRSTNKSTRPDSASSSLS